MLYPSGFCDCSASCSFVKDYLQDEDHGNDRAEMVSMRSFSGLMTPIDGDGGKFSPSELQNTLEVSFSFEILLFQVESGNALARVQRVHKHADLWDITFCTR